MGSPARAARLVRTVAAALALAVTGALTATIGEAHAAPVVDARPGLYTSFDTSAYQRNVQTYVNAHRRANGRVQLALHWALNSAAQSHANDMARMGRMTHTGSDGSNGGTRITRAGFRWSMWGENVAVGYGSSSAVVYAWMNSSGHRANILNSGFRYMGVGVTFARGTVWWCLVLAR
jgi:uncharacterized protein YkwD